MMQTLKGNQSLKLEELKVAVDAEHVSQIPFRNKNVMINDHNTRDFSVEDVHSKEVTGNVRLCNKHLWVTDICAEMNLLNKISTGKITIANRIEDISIGLMKKTSVMSSELTAEWLVRDGNAPPTIPELPLFSASPPKLGDASGRDLLGTEVSLKLIKLLCKKSTNDESSSILLDICRGCWMLTALKEKEASQALDSMDKKMIRGLDKLDSELDARLSVAGAAHSAVKQMNENERNDFIANCNQQRLQLYFLLAWEFRQLLAVQQQILTDVGVPQFDGPTVNESTISIQANVCSFLHSAFFLRLRIGEERHLKMLRSQESKLSSMKPIPMPPVAGIFSRASTAPHSQYQTANLYQSQQYSRGLQQAPFPSSNFSVLQPPLATNHTQCVGTPQMFQILNPSMYTVNNHEENSCHHSVKERNVFP